MGCESLPPSVSLGLCFLLPEKKGGCLVDDGNSEICERCWFGELNRAMAEFPYGLCLCLGLPASC